MNNKGSFILCTSVNAFIKIWTKIGLLIIMELCYSYYSIYSANHELKLYQALGPYYWFGRGAYQVMGQRLRYHGTGS